MVLVLSGVFALMAAFYMAWLGYTTSDPEYLIYAVLLLITAIGLLFKRRWSQWAVIGYTTLTIAGWVIAVTRLAMTSWPYPDATASAFGLSAGVLWMAVWIMISVVVRRSFQEPALTE